MEEMDFSEALKFIKIGCKLQRKNWNGKNMWVTLCKEYDTEWSFNGRESLPFIIMKTADDKLVPWLASQTDILANDWIQV